MPLPTRTNVLETTFETEEGAVRATDAMLLPDSGLPPDRELARRVEGLSGCVPMRWRVEPRFGYGNGRLTIARHRGTPVAAGGRDALAVSAWGAGAPVLDEISISGSFAATPGHVGLVVLSSAHQEPLVVPSRAEVESRLTETIAFWRRWAAGRTYDGPWRDAVIRSALALKLPIHSPSGAIAAAATTSLPEQLGSERNWDYRFRWVRDSAFTLHALCSSAARTRANRSLVRPASPASLSGWSSPAPSNRGKSRRTPRTVAATADAASRIPWARRTTSTVWPRVSD